MGRLGHALLAAVLVAGCGGTSFDEADYSDGGMINADGLWTGTVTDEATGAVVPVSGIAEDYEKLRLMDAAGTHYVVAMGTDGGRPIGGVALRYVPRPDLGDAVQEVVSGQMNGEVREYQRMTARMSFVDGKTLVAELAFDPLYHRNGHVSRLRGQWRDAADTVFNIESGRILGQAGDGCVYDGRVTNSDSDHNVYWLDITLAGCGNRSGTWGGLGWTADDRSPEDDGLFYLMISKSDLAELLALARL